jgi:large subunit ribosomal protein L28
MAKCAICEKSLSYGNKLSIARSHVSNRATRTWKPNLRTVKAIVDGQTKRIYYFSRNNRGFWN